MYNLAVVAGKFQTPQPTEAHIELLVRAREYASKVLVLIGQHPAYKNHEIELIPFDARRELLVSALFKHYSKNGGLYEAIDSLKDYIFARNVDVFNIDIWSKNVDTHICFTYLDLYGATPTPENVVLVGGRDSFIKAYNGMYSETCIVNLSCGDGVSGTDARKACKEHFIADPMFIKGAYHHALNQYPIAFQCVDVLIRKNTGLDIKIILGRKKNEKKYVFIGGFSEPTSVSLEADAIKEVSEEANFTFDPECCALKYVYSTLVDDPRYRNSMHKIKTALFVMNVGDSEAVFTPGDDIVEIIEVDKSFDIDILMDKHKPLYTIYKNAGWIHG